MDTAIKEKVLTVTRLGRTRAEATDWFRVALGLHYPSPGPYPGGGH